MKPDNNKERSALDILMDPEALREYRQKLRDLIVPPYEPESSSVTPMTSSEVAKNINEFADVAIRESLPDKPVSIAEISREFVGRPFPAAVVAHTDKEDK